MLRRYRLAVGFTQEVLLERAGLSAQGLRVPETGRRQVPHRHTVALLAEALHLSAAEAMMLAA